MWYGHNREGCKGAIGGVGILVQRSCSLGCLSCQREGVVWMELKLIKGRKESGCRCDVC